MKYLYNPKDKGLMTRIHHFRPRLKYIQQTNYREHDTVVFHELKNVMFNYRKPDHDGS